MPLSQSTPLYLWAYSVHFGLACFGSPLRDGDDHVSQSDFATRKIAGFLNDHFDGVIVAVIANPSESERSYWNDRTESEWQNASQAERNESPTVTALTGAMENLFGLR